MQLSEENQNKILLELIISFGHRDVYLHWILGKRRYSQALLTIITEKNELNMKLSNAQYRNPDHSKHVDQGKSHLFL